MEGAAPSSGAALVVELQPRPVLGEARPAPVEGDLAAGDGPDKAREQFGWVADGGEQRP